MELPRTTGLTSRLRILESAESTNDVLAELVSAGDEPAWSSVLTLDQTRGRGRLGRVWTAPKDKTLALSVLARVDAAVANSLGWIPLLAGAAMSTAIDELVGGGRTGLKWPNDVQIDGLKVCGILAELVPSADAVIVGSGVNLTLEQAELPVSTATSLLLAGVTDRGDALVDRVTSRYLAALQELLQRLVASRGDALDSGVHRVVTEWCRTIGREVRVSLPGGDERFGRATGIDATGRLLVRLPGGRETFAVAAGDVTHLRYE